MKTIKSLKDITTLEVGDQVVFGNLEYEVRYHEFKDNVSYFLYGLNSNTKNDAIFITLNLSATNFVKNLGIETISEGWIFPEVKSLEALTALVSALFKEYEKQQNVLPKTWEEFCERNPVKINECWISPSGYIHKLKAEIKRCPDMDRNTCTSAKEAEAFLALMQLRQLRKAYVKDWEPDWTNSNKIKYCIKFYDNQIKIDTWEYTSHVLSFPSRELAHQFLTNFKDLIEIAKPLL